ncbi:MAG: prephenate dehydrogenase/arogenate dehydrogenase family protein [Bacteroidetes bacterium]|nr:prephenate dehydrogenase/arogenate dehydrogenase family protein [Bacteroidota bacterium]
MKSREKPPFQNITIIGVGLIGGSLAMAIRQRFPSVKITGIDKPRVLKRALSCKAINIAGKSVQQAVRSADLVILAAPVTGNLKILPLVAKNCRTETTVTDTSSVKQILVKKAVRLFPGGNFIGGHPMAGSEFSGIEAANPLLFQNALYILTPAPSTKRQSLRRLANFFASLDARIFITDPATHDSVVAAISHLPQIAAVALMNSVGKHHPDAPSHLAFAAGGFRDMTRIASSPFSIWKDILSSNQKEIHKALNIYIKQLNKIASMVDSSPARLSGEFKSSCSLRSRIPRSMKGYLAPLVELVVFLEDKPGELARLASSLAKRSINIKDMELLKVREGRGGTFRLSFENRTVASEAAHALRKAGFDVSGNW